MKIVTAEMIRDLDRRAMTEGGIPGAVLMENAGRAVAEVVRARFSPLAGRPVFVACGPGNNGGDGFVIARHLLLAGADVRCRIFGDASRIQGEARVHLDILRKMGVQSCTEDASSGSIKVDALLGTGLTGPPRPDIASAIELLNRTPGPTIAVDIPSGVDSDTGAAHGVAVRADATVTFAYPKLGLFLGKGAELAGEIIVDPIGFDWESLRPEIPFSWLRAAEARLLLPARPRDGHKGTFGHVLVIGGSVGMSGAPIMTARAAARTGSGLVSAAVPRSVQPVVAAGMHELMTISLEESEGALSEEAVPEVIKYAEKADAVCLGPGLRNTSGTRRFVARILASVACPVVVDADALNAVSEEPSMLGARSGLTVLTPHPGECARLLGCSAAEIETDRPAAARHAARTFGCVVVLKGARTIICDGRGNAEPPLCINTTGNAGMATGGSGDSLTGIIGSLLGQGLEPWDAARLGVFVHACAGDLAASEMGMRGLIASDLTDRIPAALRVLEDCE